VASRASHSTRRSRVHNLGERNEDKLHLCFVRSLMLIAITRFNRHFTEGKKKKMEIDTIPPQVRERYLREQLHDRITGTIFGSALGDAIGLYTEFLTATAAETLYPSKSFTLLPLDNATPFCRDMHRGLHKTGEWTDDTDHALLILLSFLHSDGKKLDPKDFAARLKIWVDMGLRALDTLPLGLGRTVGNVVRSPDFLEKPEAIARAQWIKGKRNIAPNGSLMRTHPLGLMCLSKTLEETFHVATSYSLITHADARCVVACCIGTALVRGLVLGEVYEENDIDEIVQAAVNWHKEWNAGYNTGDETRKEDPEFDMDELSRHVKAENWSELDLDNRSTMGYVYKSLGSSVLVLRRAMREKAQNKFALNTQVAVFEKLITDLIMQAGDADTNACVAGAFLGAYLGFKALPTHWRDGLRHRDWLLSKSEGLCQVLEVSEGSYKYVGSEDPDTRIDGGRGLLTHDQIERRWMELQAWMASEDTKWKRMEEAKKKGKGLFGGSWLSSI
jgi:ADP-ribosylglycohydrolase